MASGKYCVDSGVERVVRAVGRNIAYETGIRVGLSMAARLLTGFLSGLPATAISVNASVAFFGSAFLELPTGVAADFFGRTKSVRLGYHCQVLASLCTFFAIALFPTAPTAMWALLILEGLLDAMGNALLSGAREASYQSIVESATSKMPEPDRSRLRTTYLALAEAYDRPALVVFPLVTLGAVLFLHAHGGAGHYAMLFIAAAWLIIDRQYANLARHAPPEEASSRTLSSWTRDAKDCLHLLRRGGQGLPVAILCWLVDRFVFITVTCYVMLAVLKDRALWSSESAVLPVLGITGVFLVGRVSRTFVLPGLARKFPNEALRRAGAAGQSVLAVSVLLFLPGSGSGYVVFVALAFGAYDILSGLVERPSLGLILDSIPEQIRASFLSLLSGTVLVAQFLYSVRLTALGIGVPSMTEIWSITLAGGAAMLVVSIAWATQTQPAEA